jgi:hypothetical protein
MTKGIEMGTPESIVIAIYMGLIVGIFFIIKKLRK